MRLIPKIDQLQSFSPSPASSELAGELYYGRRWSALAEVIASILLLGWGYVIMPRNGFGFWVWLLVALAGIVAAAYLFQRQVKAAKITLEKSEASLNPPQFRLPLGLVLILLVGLVANLLVIFANPQPLRFDAWGYSDQGYNIAHQGYKADAIRTPGYPLFVAVVYKLAGDERPLRDPLFGMSDPPNRNMIALWLAQSLLLSLTILLTYLLASELLTRSKNFVSNSVKIYWGKPLPLLAAGLVAFCPFLWGYTGTPQTEICAAFWLTVTVFFWVKALRYKTVAIYYPLTGFAVTLALQTRPTFVYLPLLILATLALFNKSRWRWFGPLLVAAPVVLMLVPPFAANLRDWDEPTPLIAGDLSTYQTALGTLNVIRGAYSHQLVTTPANSRISDAERERLRDYVPIQQEPDKAKRHAESDYWKNYFSNYVRAYPLEFAGTVLKRAWFQWDQHFVFPYHDFTYWDYRWLTDNLNRLYLIFGLTGFGLALLQKRYRLITLPLYITILYLTGLNLLVQDEFRYTLPAYPLLLVFAALGLTETCRTFYTFINRHKIQSSMAQGHVTVNRQSSILFTLAVLLVGGLSLALPLIPGTVTAAQGKAIDAVLASQDQAEGCFYNSAQQFLNRALSFDPQAEQIIKWQQQFPKEVEGAISNYSNRINADPRGSQGEYYRCRGDAYRVQGNLPAARADFQNYLKYAPATAQARPRVEQWLKETG